MKHSKQLHPNLQFLLNDPYVKCLVNKFSCQKNYIEDLYQDIMLILFSPKTRQKIENMDHLAMKTYVYTLIKNQLYTWNGPLNYRYRKYNNEKTILDQ